MRWARLLLPGLLAWFGACSDEAALDASPSCVVEAPGTCDPVSGCGCAAAEACRAAANQPRLTLCVPLPAAPEAPYAACSTDQECPALHACLEGLCKRLCRDPEDCGWEGAACVPASDAAGQPLATRHCTRNCDVVSPEAPGPGFQSCGAGISCVPSGDGTDCGGTLGSALAGADCGPGAGCAAGLFCSPQGRCEAWCKVGVDDCGPSLNCIPSDPPLAAGGQALGTCACRPAPGTACDFASGCGCADGQTCGIVNARVACRPLSARPVRSHAPCGSVEDCPAAHTCTYGVCQQQCVVAEDCPGVGTSCSPLLESDLTPIDGAGFCSTDCDPAAPQAPTGTREACAPGTQCSPFTDGRLCVVAGSAGEGSACVEEGDCGPGLFCNNHGTCQPWCEVGTDGCGAGRTCRGFESPLVYGTAGQPGALEVGRCVCAPSDGRRCDPSNDCGCETGGTCDFIDALGQFDCRAISPTPLAPHAACVDNVSCPALHSCIGGLCKRLCDGPGDCTAPGARCVPVSQDLALQGLSFCTISCDQVSPSDPRAGFESCGTGSQCEAATQGADCFAPAGLGAAGAACASARDCQPGLLCGLGGVCQAVCELGTESCGDGLSCQGFDFLLRSAGRDFGRCSCAPEGQGDCDIASDCGCDPGSTCNLEFPITDPPSFLCRPLSSPALEPYAPCDGDPSCPALHSCIGGVCAQRCADDGDCAGAASCQPVVDQEQPILGFNFCTRTCNPTSPSTSTQGFQRCGAGAQCFASATLGTSCAPAGSGVLHAACQEFSECLPGLFCSTIGTCEAWCRVGGDDCSGGEQCLSFETPIVTGDDEWGVCTAT